MSQDQAYSYYLRRYGPSRLGRWFARRDAARAAQVGS